MKDSKDSNQKHDVTSGMASPQWWNVPGFKKRRLKGCVKMCNVFFITHQMLLVQSLVFDNKLVP